MAQILKKETLDVCDCCLIMAANGDETGCRDYYNHTHKSINDTEYGSVNVVLTPVTDLWEESQPKYTECEVCGNEDTNTYATVVTIFNW